MEYPLLCKSVFLRRKPSSIVSQSPTTEMLSCLAKSSEEFGARWFLEMFQKALQEGSHDEPEHPRVQLLTWVDGVKGGEVSDVSVSFGRKTL